MPQHNPSPETTPGVMFESLLRIMKTLRSPEGCAWDREQTPMSLRPFVLEEAYEVVDAIDRKDFEELKSELGDLLLQVVFLSEVIKESGLFEIQDVIRSICEKLVHRHPHVFNREDDEHGPALNADEVKLQWERIKTKERAAAGKPKALLRDIPVSMPSLLRAFRLGKQAASVGFDWASVDDVGDKLDEELIELKAARATGEPNQIEEEIGDLLFTVTNLARHLKVDPEIALRSANNKFENRFKNLERQLKKRGIELADASPETMNDAWERSKR